MQTTSIYNSRKKNVNPVPVETVKGLDVKCMYVDRIHHEHSESFKPTVPDVIHNRETRRFLKQ